MDTTITKYRKLHEDVVKLVSSYISQLEKWKAGPVKESRLIANSVVDYLADLSNLCDFIQESRDQVYELGDFTQLFDMLSREFGKYQIAGVFLREQLVDANNRV